jgi:type VI secretion system secreted protein Hcp
MATDCFCKMTGITGESTDDEHKGEIELESFSLNASQAAMAAGSALGGITGGRVDLSEFNMTKVLDASSPTLFKYCCSGKKIDSVVVIVRGANEKKTTYLTYTMTDVIVANVGLSHSGSLRPKETVSLRYSTITISYSPYDNKGKKGPDVTAGYDTMANKVS